MKETKQQFERRTAWWREAKFGMFIHWGLYAVPADNTNLKGDKVISEWYQSNKQMQVSEYEKFAAQFNPVKFNARDWVRMAKEAGMKYIVITSKHHDGFCMFDTRMTDYCITKATPYKKDPLKELATECRRQGIKLCFYHSIMDWHHPDYLPRRPWEKDTRPAGNADLNRFIDYMKAQLRELLTNYGEIGVIWFDGGWEHDAKSLRSEEVVGMIRSIQPKIIINDRIQLPEDHSTPEQYIPANALPEGRLWETCMTMNDTWGFAKEDHNWKSTTDLIRKLIDIAHKGGNFLLNIGPTAEGEFPQPSIDRLREVGEWMKRNGEAIYGTTKSPFRKLSFEGRCSVKGSVIYLHVFDWGAGDLYLEGLQTRVREARSLTDGEKLSFTQTGKGEGAALRLQRPTRLDPISTTIRLTLAGKPEVISIPNLIRADSSGAFLLKAVDAEIIGKQAQYEKGNGKDNIGFWTDKNDYVTWTVENGRPGPYRVILTYACPSDNEGAVFHIGVEKGARVRGQIASTGSWTEFRELVSEVILLPEGRSVISVRIAEMPKYAAMNLRSVLLKPEQI